MAKNPSIRNYSLTDAGLVIFANKLTRFMARDSNEFSEFNIGSDDINAFQLLCDDFDAFPNDDILMDNKILATQKKSDLRKLVLKSSKNITLRVKIKFGNKSPVYKKINIVDMNNQSDKKLILSCRDIYNTSIEILPQLKSMGLSRAKIDNFNQICLDFENSLVEIKNKIELREQKKIERVILGNKFYALIIKYCEYGKQIWRYIDDMKYKDYIIYSASGS